MKKEKSQPGMIREALVDSPLNHGRCLHGAGKGLVTIARKIPGKWEQRSYPMQELYKILPAYSGVYDAYISQNRFWGPRSVPRLAQLSALYADLDYYKVPTLAEMHPLGVLDLAFEALEKDKVPYPSFAVATGRGLALTWRHHPVPRDVLPRWRLCQETIYTTLKNLGADSQAKDAARVLRLVGTCNSKSGTPVETIWQERGDAVRVFDDVANELLPFSREELAELRAQRREPRGENRQKIASKGRRKPSEGREDIEKRFVYLIYPCPGPSERSTASPEITEPGQATPRPAQRLDDCRRLFFSLLGRGGVFGERAYRAGA